MAERKNFLDREKEKRDGESYLPYSIALIPGLTALEQDALVKDIAEGLVKRNVEARQFDPENPESIYAAIERRRAADRLEEYMQRMPEPLRDSFLMSATEGAPPYFYGELTKMERGLMDGTSGFYDQDKNRVYIDKDRLINHPSTYIHENAHKTNHDLNLTHPYYEKVPRNVVPDRMVGTGLGRKISEEMPVTYLTPKGEMDKGELVDELSRILESGVNGERDAIGFYGDALIQSGIVGPENAAIPHTKRGRVNKADFREKQSMFLDDFVNLDPSFEGREYENNFKGSVTEGHPRKYKDAIQKYVGQIEWALTKGGKAERDFIDHDNTVPYAALSAESAAELAELMSTEGGVEYVKKHHPQTYEKMMDEYRADPRRSWPKERLRSWELYSHDSPMNLYKQRGNEPVAFNPNEERHYVRVPDPYGGWHYSDNYLDSRHQAVKRGKNYIEYRDLDNKWKRFYPSELKSIKENNIYGTKKWAKELGNKLLKGVK